ncbi:MAG: hypothetical protein IPJ37_02950 [Bacteroidales bacterium]|nr:hypothetical protein [Bacteroidales bacterium]
MWFTRGTTSPQTVTGLTNGATYYVKYFTRNGSLWSTGVETTVLLPEVSLSTDYFRSRATGTWATAANWESSHDGTTWFTATSAPTSAANTITILTGHTMTVGAAANDQCTMVKQAVRLQSVRHGQLQTAQVTT